MFYFFEYVYLKFLPQKDENGIVTEKEKFYANEKRTKALKSHTLRIDVKWKCDITPLVEAYHRRLWTMKLLMQDMEELTSVVFLDDIIACRRMTRAVRYLYDFLIFGQDTSICQCVAQLQMGAKLLDDKGRKRVEYLAVVCSYLGFHYEKLNRLEITGRMLKDGY
jgi:hypothetical protein